MSSAIRQLQQSNFDLHKVSPIEANRLIAFVNEFIVNVVQHLNEVSNLVDSRLHHLNNKLNICHTNLVILENKLNSIPGLASVDELVREKAVVEQPKEEKKEEEPKEWKEEEEEAGSEEKLEENGDASESREEEPAKSPKDDPLLAKYFKMLQMGVPMGAVQQKMLTEGVDPKLLN